VSVNRSFGVDDDVDELRRQRDSAVARNRELEHELGDLRGEVRRMELVMWRRIQRRQLWEARVRRVLAALGRS